MTGKNWGQIPPRGKNWGQIPPRGKNWGQIPRSRAAMGDQRLLRQRRVRMTVEKLANECLAARDLQSAGLLQGPWVTTRSLLRWPGVERMRASRYLVILELRSHPVPQQIRISWTPCHFGGARPWLHCTYCDRRVARMFKGMGGYYCRDCIGNPIYESQRRSKKARGLFEGFPITPRARRLPSCARSTAGAAVPDETSHLQPDMCGHSATGTAACREPCRESGTKMDPAACLLISVLPRRTRSPCPKRYGSIRRASRISRRSCFAPWLKCLPRRCGHLCWCCYDGPS